ncbi:YybS family protein [Bacillus infantis]|uniref:YybS family protein n=1 Tax=Bacillus infantis TaxID=324767 RepID=UPI003CF2AFB7
MKNVHKLTSGAVMLAVFAVLMLLTLYVPVLGVVTNLFLAAPFILFAATNDRKSSLVFLTGGILISLIVGTILAIPLALLYGITGTVIGDFIREKKSRFSTYMASSLAFLILLVAQYGIAVQFFEMNVIKESFDLLKQSVDKAISLMENFGQPLDEKMTEQLYSGIEMTETLIPSLLIMASFINVLILQAVSLPIVKRFGVNTEKWGQFRNLSLPKSVLWYYLITIIAALLLRPEEGTVLFDAFINLSFILQLLMIVQGLSLIFYFCHMKGYPKAVPVTAAVLSFILPFLLYIIRILGIIDLGFNLKKWLKEKV